MKNKNNGQGAPEVPKDSAAQAKTAVPVADQEKERAEIDEAMARMDDEARNAPPDPTSEPKPTLPYTAST